MLLNNLLTSLMKSFVYVPRRFACSKPHLCIIGSGPSAFYTAQFLLRHHQSVCVDMFEKLPAPFGLIRYGVAPDHPDVKNVISTFTEVARSPRFNFVGNVTVGKDLRLHELQRAYCAVILAYGASVDRRLKIPGEDLAGVLSAKDLVGWYNGAPSLSNFQPDLNCDTVAVVGIGNVALDVARILLSSTSRLQSTDIPEPVMSVLHASKIRRVVIVGRRGPLQVAFTLKEIRELSRLEVDGGGSSPSSLPIRLLPENVLQTCFGTTEQVDLLLSDLPRARRRLTKFLLQLASDQPLELTAPSKHCDLLFFRSPVRILPRETSVVQAGGSMVGKIELEVNKLAVTPAGEQIVSRDPDSPTELLECGLVVRSIGYRSVQIDPDLPFDDKRGIILSKDMHGRVADSFVTRTYLDACPLYCTGWAKRGAVGVIVDTAMDARDTAQTVLADLASAEVRADPTVTNKLGLPSVMQRLHERGIRTVSFADWERVDEVERLAGKALGKPREKLTSVESMLRVAFAEATQHKRDYK
ncbi:hypothetical protein EG68_09412 [Paragonimus skrjabini miyazakii]|uniref:NADPH:adrenodoxin oxidoreductase, mitochondrial n=1 Tax=Paragonimus skrjabini miyazakii TaxID=59628 RepID=A0A8S9YM84_9TREM|nr:hypothetical protein EG68_09412 [Paragonimus skrjabini miyazakii]